MKQYTDAEASLAAAIANDVNECTGLTRYTRYSKLQLRAAVAYWSDFAAREATRAAGMQGAIDMMHLASEIMAAHRTQPPPPPKLPTLATKPLAEKHRNVLEKSNRLAATPLAPLLKPKRRRV